MKIPNREHPHEGTQRELQHYEPNLWLVFLRRIQRWAVVYEGREKVSTNMHLAREGLEECRAPTTFWQIAKVCWDRNGKYVCPTQYRSLILFAVRGNDAALHGTVAERAEKADAHQLAGKDRAREEIFAKGRDAANASLRALGTNKVTFIGKDQVIKPYARQQEERRLAQTGS